MVEQLKCYNCGGDVIIGENPFIGICSNCFAEVPLPKDLVSLGQAYSHANSLLSASRFQEAKDAFQEILVKAPLEASACWGYAVSEYGIEFVQDPATAQLLPTLHRLSNTRFSDFFYVQKAIEYAPDYYTKEFYTAQSQLIDSIQSQSLQISRKEDPYDVFICYKKTEEGERRTADSRIAADLYKELIRRGYKTFFAEETLHVGEEYEPRIFAALNSARILLAIGSREEYYEAPWVKNEWSRYVDLIREDSKQGIQTRLLIPVYHNIPHEQIPAALQKMPQSVDLSAPGNPKHLLFTMINDHFSGGQNLDGADLRRQVRGRSANIRMEASAENYITRGTIELVNGKFDTAAEMFHRACSETPSTDAYLGLAMCDLKVPGKEALHQYAGDLAGNTHFVQALEIATPDQRQELEAIAKTCLENKDWAATCQRKQKECEKAAEQVINALQDFSLPLDSHRACAKAEDCVKFAASAKSVMKLDSSVTKILRRFLLLGNLIPAILFFVSATLEKIGIFTDVEWLALPGAILMIVMYIATGISLLGHIPILDGGFFTVLIRLAIGYAASMLLATQMEKYGARVLWLILSAAAFGLFCTTLGRRYASATKSLVNARKEAKIYLQQIPQLFPALELQTQEALTAAIAPYQQYYGIEDWNTRTQHWANVLHNACAARLNVQAEALRHL